MNNEILDLPEFLERVQDDKELLLELVEIYKEDYQQKRKLLEHALETNNYEEIRGIAHSLKGASGNISAKLVRQIFFKFEEIGKTQDLSDYQQLLSELDAQYAALVKCMDQLKDELSA